MPKLGPIASAVLRSTREAQLPATDEAGVKLAIRLARLLDAAQGTEEEVGVFNDLAPKLLASLTALGLTAQGRAKTAPKGGVERVSVSGPEDALAKLRAKKRAG